MRRAQAGAARGAPTASGGCDTYRRRRRGKVHRGLVRTIARGHARSRRRDAGGGSRRGLRLRQPAVGDLLDAAGHRRLRPAGRPARRWRLLQHLGWVRGRRRQRGQRHRPAQRLRGGQPPLRPRVHPGRRRLTRPSRCTATSRPTAGTAGVPMALDGDTWRATLPRALGHDTSSTSSSSTAATGSPTPKTPTRSTTDSAAPTRWSTAQMCDDYTCEPTLIGTFDWRDAVIYFVFVDRFFDGDAGNNGPIGVPHGVELPGRRLGRGHRRRSKRVTSTISGVNVLWLSVPMDNTSAERPGHRRDALLGLPRRTGRPTSTRPRRTSARWPSCSSSSTPPTSTSSRCCSTTR